MGGTATQLSPTNYPGKDRIDTSIAGDAIVYDVRDKDYARVQCTSIGSWPASHTITVLISVDGGSTFYAPATACVFSASGNSGPLIDVQMATHMKVYNSAASGSTWVLVSASAYKES